MLLDLSERSKLTSKLHVFVLFPDVFGPLSEDDRELYFDGKKFKSGHAVAFYSVLHSLC